MKEKKVCTIKEFINITTAPLNSIKHMLVLEGNNLLNLEAKSDSQLRQMLLNYITVDEKEYFDFLIHGDIKEVVILQKVADLIDLPTAELYRKLGFSEESIKKTEPNIEYRKYDYIKSKYNDEYYEKLKKELEAILFSDESKPKKHIVKCKKIKI